MSRASSKDATNPADPAGKDAEHLFRHLMDSAPVMIWVSGPDKLCTWFNKPWLDFTGRTLEQERGSGWAEGVHRDDLERCLKTYAAHFDARTPFRMEYRLRRADGAYRTILDTGGPRFSSGGAFLGYIGSCIEVSALPADAADAPGAGTEAVAPSPQAPSTFVADETRVRQIARALVTAHRAGALSVATGVAHRHAATGESKIADFWQTVAVSVREILTRDE